MGKLIAAMAVLLLHPQLVVAEEKCTKSCDCALEAADFCGANGRCLEHTHACGNETHPLTCQSSTCWCRSGFEQGPSGACISEASKFAYYKSLCLLGVLLLFGKTLRVTVPAFGRTFMPAAIIAGLFFFSVLQIMEMVDPVFKESFTHEFTYGWSNIGPFAVDVLFGSLFLGTEIPSFTNIVNKAGPQFIYNQLINWGMWLVSLLVVICICTPVFGSDPLLATLVPAGFTGGHAIVYALADDLTAAGYSDGIGIGLYISTVGQVMSFILGTYWINIAVAMDLLPARPKNSSSGDQTKAHLYAQGLFPDEEMPSAGKLTCSPDSMDVMTLHAAVVFVTMFCGITASEVLNPLTKANFGFAIPRFVWCMTVGIVFQMIYEKLVRRNAIPSVLDPAIMSRLQGLVLDFLITSAMSTVDIASILPQLAPATIVSVVCLVWLGIATWYIAPWFLPDHKFERAICEYGQATGVISSGLILLKMCDPGQKLPVMESFALKNFAAMPLLFTFLPLTIPIVDGPSGSLTIVAISSGILVVLISIWYFYYRPIFQRMGAVDVEMETLDNPDTKKNAQERYSRGSVGFI